MSVTKTGKTFMQTRPKLLLAVVGYLWAQLCAFVSYARLFKRRSTYRFLV